MPGLILFHFEFERSHLGLDPHLEPAFEFMGHSPRVPAGAASAIRELAGGEDLALFIQDFYMRRRHRLAVLSNNLVVALAASSENLEVHMGNSLVNGHLRHNLERRAIPVDCNRGARLDSDTPQVALARDPPSLTLLVCRQGQSAHPVGARGNLDGLGCRSDGLSEQYAPQVQLRAGCREGDVSFPLRQGQGAGESSDDDRRRDQNILLFHTTCPFHDPVRIYFDPSMYPAALNMTAEAGFCYSFWSQESIIFDMDDESKTLMRMIPSVDSVLRDPCLEAIKADLGTTLTTAVVREVVDDLRQQLTGAEGGRNSGEADIYEGVLTETMRRLEGIARPYYGPVVNGTGIILHTGLGRAVLARKVLEQVQSTLQGYSLLQLDAETGGRGKRDERIEWLLQRLTGAEGATVVNNNAAATAIVLNTVARDREVIVSRGQLVEIGGSFRLPDVMAFSGARLIEVGTTNKTHPRDYENAITERTAAILRVHPSNYKIEGFSSEVPLDILAKIAHDHQLTLIDDVGAGALIDFSQFGFAPEPTLPDSIRAGADIVTCSADKLIGASQGGIILGKKRWIDAVRRNQFARIVRVGKLTLAALEATLKLFLDEAVALREVPTLQMLRRSAAEIREQAERLAGALSEQVPAAKVTTIPGFSQMGSGSLPTQNLATTLVAIAPRKISAEFLAKRLRAHTPPVVARIQNDQVLLDPRTLREGDDAIILQAIAASLAEGKRGC